MNKKGSLRKQFKQMTAAEYRADLLLAADAYLNQLADHLVEKIQQKVKDRDVYKFGQGPMESPMITFPHASLSQVTVAEVKKMRGYQRLNEICAQPDVDMCIGIPVKGRHALSTKIFNKLTVIKPESHPFRAVRIFIERPYAHSAHARDQKRLKRQQKKAARHAQGA